MADESFQAECFLKEGRKEDEQKVKRNKNMLSLRDERSQREGRANLLSNQTMAIKKACAHNPLVEANVFVDKGALTTPFPLDQFATCHFRFLPFLFALYCCKNLHLNRF